MYDWQVFSTLSFSGSTLFSKWNRGFDVVIIDEAAQAVSSDNNFVFLISL
jgi:superfamily I DNA and/or RNA helicase